MEQKTCLGNGKKAEVLSNFQLLVMIIDLISVEESPKRHLISYVIMPCLTPPPFYETTHKQAMLAPRAQTAANYVEVRALLIFLVSNNKVEMVVVMKCNAHICGNW